jgi:hypothetical protein
MSYMLEKLSYRETLTLVDDLYRKATGTLHLNCYQAFAYAYDETELLRDGDKPSSWIISLTALFVCAHKYGVDFVLTDPFTNDVFTELSKSYGLYSVDIFDKLNMREEEVKEFLQDMKLVTEIFLA